MGIKHSPLHRGWMVGLALALVLVGVAAGYPLWWPRLQPTLAAWASPISGAKAAAEGKEEEEGHDHGHAHQEEASAIEISANGLRNIGYEPLTVKLQDFQRSIVLPGIVAERPGRSQLQITAPFTGVVTRIHATQGAAIEPGSPLFDIRLTHEDLVTAQRDFLRDIEGLDVIQREIQRLKALGDAVVAGKRVIEQEYERQKLEASLAAERQSLLLHGLAEPQVEEIRRSRKLIQSLTVNAPAHEHEDESCGDEHLFHAQELPVVQGQQVEAGAVLAVLADHCELYIEGYAYPDDAVLLREAMIEGRPVVASLLAGRGQQDTLRDLKLLHLADRVDEEARTFRFYVRLPNRIVGDRTTPAGKRFMEWRFKPGQRMELRVPVETWEKRIVLPTDAVVREGVEAYAYRQNGKRFDRVSVHVEFADQKSAVIANNGALFPGDVVAAQGAYQMHLALKNKSGGAIDPHAGHNH